MTPPPLPAVLERLAERVPSRVRLGQRFSDGVQTIHVYDDTWADRGGWLHVYTVDPALEAGGIQFDRSWRDTRTALEQECAARGWDVMQDANHTWSEPARRYGATVFRPGDGPSYIHRAYADTPALALACALLAALEGAG